MLKCFLSILLSVSLPLQTFAISKPIALQPNFDEQASYISQMQNFLKVYTDKYYVEKSLERFKSNFKNPEDRAYIQKMLAYSKRPKQLIVVSTKNTIEIKTQELPKITLSDFNPLNSSMKINGKEFKVKPGDSLETTNKKLADLMLSPAAQAHLLELFLPRAYAQVDPVALTIALLVGLVIVAPTLYQLARLYSHSSHVNSIIEECENRDESVPYELSKTDLLVKQITPKENPQPTATKPKITPIYPGTDCALWAAEATKAFNKELPGTSLSVGLVQRWCVSALRADQCVEDYKAGKPKKAQDTSKASSTGAGRTRQVEAHERGVAK